MAGTIEVVERFRMNVENPIEYIELLWTSDGSGDAEGEIDLRGEFANVSFQPGEDDVQPSDEYDVTMLDNAGCDLLAGMGADLSNTTPVRFSPSVDAETADNATTYAVLCWDTVTIAVANAGAANQGTIRLYLRCF